MMGEHDQGEDVQRAGEQALLKVFQPDVLDAPFVPSVARRGVLYPVLWDLDQETIDALMGAALSVGDRGMYHVFVERLPPEVQLRHLGPPVAYYPIDSPASAVTIRDGGGLATALVSATARWGVLITEDELTVVGGDELFMQAFDSRLSVHLDQQLRTLLEFWCRDRTLNGYSRRHWAMNFLTNLFGQETAIQLLNEYDV